ncbi:hypothetical protein BASA50_005625 [Batrachochytrium salamandrivorans]|uniref:Uncharacterized protein n=1 Tax=Batrachochytrium salamandrivorans TaxID=1357716 RepID=A0ABQ8FF99_9FUNG|nr:hypothetical protein BASA60_004698 [Batrachochytrium salamandrivorans]KAH6588141.1 hypothetical protein BASA61_006087 [Batrachochytrium salamandrivorans]KAH6595724.1 hypothetical protein BASA50_005625 [Batrachochytrium salamandrivorans]KAH9266380.1 hypothetical protein BASA83_010622 [Batrachochytrium salamandrivorans]
MATKEEWLQLIDQEDGESLAISLIQEILQRSQHILFEKHIDVQVLPYAVGFARDTLVSLINYQFFRCDPGNTDTDLWEPDDELEPVTIDSWARGAVPIRIISSDALRTEPTRQTDTTTKLDIVARSAEPISKKWLQRETGVPKKIDKAQLKRPNQPKYGSKGNSVLTLQAKSGTHTTPQLQTCSGKTSPSQSHTGISPTRSSTIISTGHPRSDNHSLVGSSVEKGQGRAMPRISSIGKEGEAVPIKYGRDGQIGYSRNMARNKRTTDTAAVQVIAVGEISPLGSLQFKPDSIYQEKIGRLGRHGKPGPTALSGGELTCSTTRGRSIPDAPGSLKISASTSVGVEPSNPPILEKPKRIKEGERRAINIKDNAKMQAAPYGKANHTNDIARGKSRSLAASEHITSKGVLHSSIGTDPHGQVLSLKTSPLTRLLTSPPPLPPPSPPSQLLPQQGTMADRCTSTLFKGHRPCDSTRMDRSSITPRTLRPIHGHLMFGHSSGKGQSRLKPVVLEEQPLRLADPQGQHYRETISPVISPTSPMIHPRSLECTNRE